MNWTDEAIERLRALWAEGLTTREIGRRMGLGERLDCGKNSITSKVHQLRLPPRPSPIRKKGSGEARPSVPRRVIGPTLPALRPDEAAAETLVEVVLPITGGAQSLSAHVKRTSVCCWPIGEVGTKSFRFCDAQAEERKPYCHEHAQVAYIKVRDRHEGAA